ncbi:hypothetical protein D9M70_620850 [compost metagenome]
MALLLSAHVGKSGSIEIVSAMKGKAINDTPAARIAVTFSAFRPASCATRMTLLSVMLPKHSSAGAQPLRRRPSA